MLYNYLTIALRTLRRHWTFSVINILGLSVGMTAFFLIFQYVRFETSFDRFHSKADRIYRVVADIITPTETLPSGRATAPIAINMKKDFPEVEDAVRLGTDSYLIQKGDIKFQELNTILADSTFFNIFDFPLVEGDRRTALIHPMSIILSQSTAKKYFGAADPMGQHLLLTGGMRDAIVTGVMKDIPENSQIKADVIVSLSSNEELYGRPTADSEWTNHNYYTYLLLRPHIDAKALQAKLPAWMEMHNGRLIKQLQMHDSLILEPFRDVYLHSKYDGFVSGSLSDVYIFSVIGLFILLLAGINFINLTTARSTERAKEVGIRKVVGALRFQLTRQFIGETVVLAVLAFGLTLILCSLLMPLFNFLAGKTISTGIFSHPADILTLFALAMVVGVTAGFYPALILSAFRPVNVLKGHFSTGSHGALLRKGLVVFQFTISISLLIATGIVYAQLNYMRTRDLGYTRDETMIIPTNGDSHKDLFQQSLASLPGVISTCFSSNVPGSSGVSAYSELEDSKGEMIKTNLNTYFVDFNFIPQYDLRLVAGRGFSRSFATDSTNAMVINESAVRLLGYPTAQAAIGRNFSQWGTNGQIIGVLKDFHYEGLRNEIQPMAMRYQPFFAWISIKVSVHNLPSTVKAIGDKWTSAIPYRPYEYYFLDEWFDQQYRAQNRFGNLFFNFALLAVFISCLGLLGLASYNTLQRTKEIGIRKILGANASRIVNLLSIDFVKLVGIAFLIASPLAWLGMDQWLAGFAYHMPMPWWIFVATGLTAVLIAFLTIGYQAIRAALANPVRSLRSE